MQALALLREGKITRAKAAELAGVSIYEIIELAAKQGIPISYDKEDLAGPSDAEGTPSQVIVRNRSPLMF